MAHANKRRLQGADGPSDATGRAAGATSPGSAGRRGRGGCRLRPGQGHYLTVEQNYSTLLDVYAPLMLAFGVIALDAAVLIVANVIGGAVVSGYRHIGVLKASGYTPDQVTAVYLIMLKSIGMTPREATLMMVTSMAELGVAGTLIGLPLGILVQRVVVAAMTRPAFFMRRSWVLTRAVSSARLRLTRSARDLFSSAQAD